jgi:P-type conjugative transfer protein TrbG
MRRLRPIPVLLLAATALTACTRQRPPEIAYDDQVPPLRPPPAPPPAEGPPRPSTCRQAWTPSRGGDPEADTPRGAHHRQCRRPGRTPPAGLLQRHAGISVERGRALPGLCRTRADHEYRARTRRTPDRPGPIAAGDTARWIIGDTTSGAGRTERVHILVKPTRPDISTNLVVNTDRRTYHIELHADEETWMPSVAWAYPEVRSTPRVPDNPPPAIPPEAERHYRYGLQGDAPPWRPVSVFDDGRRVYVVFPPGIAQGEMPPLFVIGADGRGQIVNTRVLGNVLIVDRLFGAAELRLGERQQQVVRIVRTDGDQRPPRAPQPEAER